MPYILSLGLGRSTLTYLSVPAAPASGFHPALFQHVRPLIRRIDKATTAATAQQGGTQPLVPCATNSSSRVTGQRPAALPYRVPHRHAGMSSSGLGAGWHQAARRCVQAASASGGAMGGADWRCRDSQQTPQSGANSSGGYHEPASSNSNGDSSSSYSSGSGGQGGGPRNRPTSSRSPDGDQGRGGQGGGSEGHWDAGGVLDTLCSPEFFILCYMMFIMAVLVFIMVTISHLVAAMAAVMAAVMACVQVFPLMMCCCCPPLFLFLPFMLWPSSGADSLRGGLGLDFNVWEDVRGALKDMREGLEAAGVDLGAVSTGLLVSGCVSGGVWAGLSLTGIATNGVETVEKVAMGACLGCIGAGLLCLMLGAGGSSSSTAEAADQAEQQGGGLPGGQQTV